MHRPTAVESLLITAAQLHTRADLGRRLSGRTCAYCGGVDNEQAFPVIRQTVLETTDPRRLAEFYLQHERR
jgi:hypothetical protein